MQTDFQILSLTDSHVNFLFPTHFHCVATLPCEIEKIINAKISVVLHNSNNITCKDPKDTLQKHVNYYF